MTNVLLIVYLIVMSLFAMTTTIIFCFWFVYLQEAIRRKWRFYRSYLRCLQRGEVSSQQQILTYNAETEFVKYVFLFFMNIVEWLAFILAYVDYMFTSEQISTNCQGAINGSHSANKSENWFEKHVSCLVNATNSRIHSNSVLLLANNCVVLSLVLIASLCNYLAARSAQKTWITSKRIPYSIGIFVVALIAIHFAAFHCSIIIIARWCNALLMTASLLMLLKQYRLLSMVIDWTIVDLRVSKNSDLMERQIKMKRRFSRVFTSLWIGIVIILANKYIGNLLSTSTLVIRFCHTKQFEISLCENTNYAFHQFTDIIVLIYLIKRIFIVVGSAFIFIPYIGYGVCTMYVILWRRITGQTGYKTRYHNDSQM